MDIEESTNLKHVRFEEEDEEDGFKKRKIPLMPHQMEDHEVKTRDENVQVFPSKPSIKFKTDPEESLILHPFNCKPKPVVDPSTGVCMTVCDPSLCSDPNYVTNVHGKKYTEEEILEDMTRLNGLIWDVEKPRLFEDEQGIKREVDDPGMMHNLSDKVDYGKRWHQKLKEGQNRLVQDEIGHIFPMWTKDQIRAAMKTVQEGRPINTHYIPEVETGRTQLEKPVY